MPFLFPAGGNGIPLRGTGGFLARARLLRVFSQGDNNKKKKYKILKRSEPFQVFFVYIYRSPEESGQHFE
jgi:hypothetical protein